MQTCLIKKWKKEWKYINVTEAWLCLKPKNMSKDFKFENHLISSFYNKYYIVGLPEPIRL